MRCCVTLMQRSALHLLLLELAWPGPIGALAQSDRHARQAWQSQQCELLLFFLSCTEIACALPRPIWRIVYSGCRRAPAPSRSSRPRFFALPFCVCTAVRLQP